MQRLTAAHPTHCSLAVSAAARGTVAALSPGLGPLFGCVRVYLHRGPVLGHARAVEGPARSGAGLGTWPWDLGGTTAKQSFP